MTWLDAAYLFRQEWQCQWTHPETDQSISDGNVGHLVWWWLCQRGQGECRFHICQRSSIITNTSVIFLIYSLNCFFLNLYLMLYFSSMRRPRPWFPASNTLSRLMCATKRFSRMQYSRCRPKAPPTTSLDFILLSTSCWTWETWIYSPGETVLLYSAFILILPLKCNFSEDQCPTGKL